MGWIALVILIVIAVGIFAYLRRGTPPWRR